MTSRLAGTLFVALLVVVAGAAPVIGAVDADSTPPTNADAPWTPAVEATAPGASTPTAPQTDGEPTVHQRAVASRNPEPESVTLTFEYEVPSSVSGLRIVVPVASLPGVTVAGTEGFERTEPTRFLWDGETERPSVSFRLAVGDSLSAGVRGVETAEWALVSEPNTRVEVRTDGRPVRTTTFDVAAGEEGYASSHLAYLGPHERRNVTVADERATFVLGDADADPERAIAFLRTANEHFDLGIRRDRITVFVLPLTDNETDGIEAATVDTAFWVSESALRFDESGTVFAHEYVHTRLNTVGRDDAAWLTEATAEYYGRLFAFNDGVGSYDAFLSGLRATEYAPDRRSVTLAEPDTWTGTTAHYTKGAHVLAALDAQIRSRTDGERTLRDVFEGRSQPFRDYRAFRAAVIEVAGDDAIGPWLDRYVTTDALPPLPEEPRYYVAEPSLDPDGDGVASGVELDRGRHPFVAGEGTTRLDDRTTGTATGTAATTATPTPTSTTAGPTPTGTEGQAPGFGVGAVVVAAAAALLVGWRRREEG